jgi:hypothetical protein
MDIILHRVLFKIYIHVYIIEFNSFLIIFKVILIHTKVRISLRYGLPWPSLPCLGVIFISFKMVEKKIFEVSLSDIKT